MKLFGIELFERNKEDETYAKEMVDELSKLPKKPVIVGQSASTDSILGRTAEQEQLAKGRYVDNIDKVYDPNAVKQFSNEISTLGYDEGIDFEEEQKLLNTRRVSAEEIAIQKDIRQKRGSKMVERSWTLGESKKDAHTPESKTEAIAKAFNDAVDNQLLKDEEE